MQLIYDDKSHTQSYDGKNDTSLQEISQQGIPNLLPCVAVPVGGAGGRCSFVRYREEGLGAMGLGGHEEGVELFSDFLWHFKSNPPLSHRSTRFPGSHVDYVWQRRKVPVDWGRGTTSLKRVPEGTLLHSELGKSSSPHTNTRIFSRLSLFYHKTDRLEI